MPTSPPTARRRKMANRRLLSLMAGLAFAAAAGPSRAQADYPNRPVKIMVGFTPGGGPDITARHVAQKLIECCRHQDLIENRPCAGGTHLAAPVALPSTTVY